MKKRAFSRTLSFAEDHPSLASAPFFLVLTLLFFAPAIKGDLMFRDAFHEVFTMRFLWRWSDRGGLPLWNPHTFLGLPVSGSVFFGLWYPVNLLLFYVLKLSPAGGGKVYLIFHYWLLGPCFLFFLKKLQVKTPPALAAAVGYAFNGFLVSMHYAGNLLPSFVLIPFTLGLMAEAGREKKILFTLPPAATCGLIFLGGDPLGFGLCLLLGSVVFVFEARSKAKKSRSARNAPEAGESRVINLARSGLCVLAFGVAAFMVCGIEYFPAWTVAAASARAGGFPFDLAACWSFHPARLVEFFLANPFGLPWPVDHYWAAFLESDCFLYPMALSAYPGIWMVLAAGFGIKEGIRRREGRALLFSGLFAGFLVLALGRFTPLYEFFYRHVPGMSLFRYPEKFLYPAIVCLAALSGLGGERILYGKDFPGKKNRPTFWLIFWVTGAALAGAALVWVGGRVFGESLARLMQDFLTGKGSIGVSPRSAVEGLGNSSARSLFFLALCVFAAGVLRRTKSVGSASLIPAAILFLDLWHANRMLAPSAPGLYEQRSRAADFILCREGLGRCQGLHDNRGRESEPKGLKSWPQVPAGGFRIFRINNIPAPPGLSYEELRRWERDTLKPNLGLVEGFEYFAGMNVAHTRRQEELISKVIVFDHLPVFNVKYAIVPEEWEDELAGQAEVLSRFSGVLLLELPQVFPRALWVRDAVPARSKSELFSLLLKTDFKKQAVIETPLTVDEPPFFRILWPRLSGIEESGNPGNGGNEPTPSFLPAEIEEYLPNRVRVRVEAPARGWLVLNDSWYPGWSAAVDGKPAAVYRANGLVRVVPVEKGVHIVEFRFRPRTLLAGSILTCLALAAGLAAWGGRRKR